MTKHFSDMKTQGNTSDSVKFLKLLSVVGRSRSNQSTCTRAARWLWMEHNLRWYNWEHLLAYSDVLMSPCRRTLQHFSICPSNSRSLWPHISPSFIWICHCSYFYNTNKFWAKVTVWITGHYSTIHTLIKTKIKTQTVPIAQIFCAARLNHVLECRDSFFAAAAASMSEGLWLH